MKYCRQRPSNFLLVRSEHAHASYPGLSLSCLEPTILLTSDRKSRALGATISGMRHRCRLRETGWAEDGPGWAEFGYFLCYFKMVAPRALVFRPLVKGNEDSGNEIAWAVFSPARVQPLYGAGRKESSGTGLSEIMTRIRFEKYKM